MVAMSDSTSANARAEALQRVRTRWQSDPYVQLLGIEIVDFAPGKATLRLPMSQKILNGGSGVPHGGALCSAMDIAIGIALNAANARPRTKARSARRRRTSTSASFPGRAKAR